MLNIEYFLDYKDSCTHIPTRISFTYLCNCKYSLGRLRRWRKWSVILFLPTPWFPTSNRCSPSSKSFSISSMIVRCYDSRGTKILYIHVKGMVPPSQIQTITTFLRVRSNNNLCSTLQKPLIIAKLVTIAFILSYTTNNKLRVHSSL